MRASLRLLTLLLALFACAVPALAQVTTPPASPVQAALDQARATMVQSPQEGLRLASAAEVQATRMPQGRDRIVAIATARWLRSEAYLRLDNAAAARPLIARTLEDIAPIKEPIKLRGDLLLSLGSLQMDDGQARQQLSGRALFRRQRRQARGAILSAGARRL